ncbi:adhesion G-protein coupled receptor G2-like [Denticeps clupeoides]|nr:adhesion G-protein coupled receptor G2-like [Denticeps clupeoides]
MDNKRRVGLLILTFFYLCSPTVGKNDKENGKFAAEIWCKVKYFIGYTSQTCQSAGATSPSSSGDSNNSSNTVCSNTTTVDEGYTDFIIPFCSNTSSGTNCGWSFDTNNTTMTADETPLFQALGYWLYKEGTSYHIEISSKSNLSILVKLYGENATRSVNTDTLCKGATFDDRCNLYSQSFGYRIDLNNDLKCRLCGNPAKPLSVLKVNFTFGDEKGSAISPKDAATAMKDLRSVADMMGNLTAAAISIGPVSGVMVKANNISTVQTLSIVQSDNLSIVESEDVFSKYPISLSVPKEAFEIAFRSQNTTFAGVFKFPNLGQDTQNTLYNSIYAIEMGVNVSNLSNPIRLNIKLDKEGTRNYTCSSWDGEGNATNWTTDGCFTSLLNGTVTCECSHLTFFAVLMTQDPSNYISKVDLDTLTYITYIGCGMSMFFLGIALLKHAVVRNTRHGSKILANLFVALFLLNLLFLSNTWMTNLNNVILCKAVASLMHYFMLSSFNWFAVEAFHLCLQIYRYSSSDIHNYMVKVCIAGWAPSMFVVMGIFSVGKYGNLTITTYSGNSVSMCWITDSFLHYVVNTSYYSLIFLFTFITFIIMLHWLHLLRSKIGSSQLSGRAGIFTIVGLFCSLGLSWGFAFFSYGALRVPSYYIFTILNSFQGFILFLYYYKTNMAPVQSSQTNTSVSTLNIFDNPYVVKK